MNGTYTIAAAWLGLAFTTPAALAAPTAGQVFFERNCAS